MIRFIRGKIKGRLYRLSWWYIRRTHDSDAGLARIDELAMRIARLKREPHLFTQTNLLMEELIREAAQHGELTGSWEATFAELIANGVPQCHTE
jgi:hypothetical protein